MHSLVQLSGVYHHLQRHFVGGDVIPVQDTCLCEGWRASAEEYLRIGPSLFHELCVPPKDCLKHFRIPSDKKVLKHVVQSGQLNHNVHWVGTAGG